MFRTLSAFFLLAATAPAAPVNFQLEVRPIIERRCLACHQGDKPAANLVLDAAGLQRVVVPGKPSESLLVSVIEGARPRMPKAGPPLDPAEIAAIRRWIAEGAAGNTPAGSAAAAWWSLTPVRRIDPASLPVSRPGWIRQPIDRFILSALDARGLSPSPEAGRRTLIRRLYYDLHGLPPSWEEVTRFVTDPAPDAYERLADRLLASPRYAERWGRHWLDVAHYGESHGYDKDKPRRNAWPYRDYVIRAIHEDKPYGRFIEEQIAGDVLFPEDPSVIPATGFITAGPWDFVGHAELREDTVDKKITRNLDRDDMVMGTMSAFASTTAHCARCHDHKFDPIPQRDHYALQAVFAGIDRADRPFDSDPDVHRKRLPLLARERELLARAQPLRDLESAGASAELTALDDQVREWRRQVSGKPDAAIQARIDAALANRKKMLRSLLPQAPRAELEDLDAALAAVQKELAALPKPQLVYAAANVFPVFGTFRWPIEPRPVHLLGRGSVESPGELMQPGALSAVSALPARFAVDPSAGEGPRRAALAKWLSDPRNPLTWRSIVNRIWQHHFGIGLVDTPNDFGRMGSKPTHPELLDWLASELQLRGGSLKQLHREIVLSATYRQSSAADSAKEKLDSGNRYLWRMNRRRLDAEALRDAALAVSGKLDLTMGGPSAEQFWFKDDHSPVYDYARFDPDSPGSYRRSVYRFLVRSVPDPFMERLDCPDASLVVARRNETITAIQALALLNNRFMVRQAEHLATRVRTAANSLEEQLRIAWQLASSRDPEPSERKVLTDYAARHGLENACRILLNSNEFLFVD